MAYQNNVTDTLFADVSEFQTPVNNAYTDAGYRVLSIRSNDGTHQDLNIGANYPWCVQAADDGRLTFFIVYCYWRANWAQTGQTLIDTINGLGGPHPRMVVMLDVESGGNPGGDESDPINRLYWQMADWLGTDARVIGYANLGDERTMWQLKPQHIPMILAGYGANPDDASVFKVAHQYTDGTGYGGGLPEGAPPWPTCDMNSADGLSDVAFAAACGVGVSAPVPPPPPGPLPAPSWALPTDDSIYAAAAVISGQFVGS